MAIIDRFLVEASNLIVNGPSTLRHEEKKTNNLILYDELCLPAAIAIILPPPTTTPSQHSGSLLELQETIEKTDIIQITRVFLPFLI